MIDTPMAAYDMSGQRGSLGGSASWHQNISTFSSSAPGLSGIGAGYHLQQKCPGKSFAILEGRDCIGGTWDLFRYPGIRSDSDMFTMGYSFKPWTEPKAIADGPQILNYVRETAAENGIDKKIRFQPQRQARVVVVAGRALDRGGRAQDRARARTEIVRFTCNFLFMCSGYYKYEEGYTPEFAGSRDFAGRIVHPQKWPDDLDYAGKRVVVIGSGATAVTLVPEMAKTAAHVTMLQRSPTYVVARPARGSGRQQFAAQSAGQARLSPDPLAQRAAGACISSSSAGASPARVKQLILGGVRMALGPDYDVATHFTPRYNPWDQRLCLVPDGDLFKAIRDNARSVVTNEIDTFTKNGIRLKDGSELEADIIVTATGLVLQVLGGMEVSVDGRVVDFARTLNYKGMMYSDVPNLASSFGYTNASWTLKCDLTCEYVCRLINYMDRHGYKQCMPHNVDPTDHRIAVAGFLLRLCAARGRENAEAGLEAAMAAVPELRARHRHAALRQGR